MATHVRSKKWRDLRLPIGHKQWENIFNAYPDADIDTILSECYDLGYAMHRTGLISL